MPLPSPFLFPSPNLLPGDIDLSPGPFSDTLLQDLSPWNDPGGWWATYNTALGRMFEPVYDITADAGDPSETQVAVTTTDIDAFADVSSLSVLPLAEDILAGTELTTTYLTFSQDWTTSEEAVAGSTAIQVETNSTTHFFPAGSPVTLSFEPGWSRLLDPDDCPDQFLAYLAQFVGADVPLGTDPAIARAKIRDETAWKRGTPSAILAAATANLKGTQSVVLIERTAASGNVDAYHFLLIVRPEEVVSVSALTDAVNLTKPGGIQWTLIQTDGWTITQMEAYKPTIVLLEAAFRTLTGLELDQPGT